MAVHRAHWAALLLFLPMLSWAGSEARADLWVWERDFYVHRDVDEAYVRKALLGGNRSLQRKHNPGDVACPVELRVRNWIVYDGETPGMVDRPGALQPPSSHQHPGFYFHNGRGPAHARMHQQVASLWVFEPRKVDPHGAPALRRDDMQAWAVAHEWGHLAGLAHILRPRRAEVDDPTTPEDERNTSDAPCTLMSYKYGFPSPPKMGVACKSGLRIEAWQCDAYKQGADRIERLPE